MFASQKLKGAVGDQFTYHGVGESIGSSSAHTFSNFSIGPANPDRIVVVTMFATQGDGTATTLKCTIGGVTTNIVQGGNIVRNKPAIGWLKVASGTTANIVVSATSGFSYSNVLIGVYTFNTKATTTLDSGYVSAGRVTSLTFSDLQCANKGVAIYAGGAHLNGGTTGGSWNGIDTLVNDRTAQFQGNAAGHGHVLTTEASTIRDLTYTQTLAPGSTTRLVCVSFAFI